MKKIIVVLAFGAILTITSCTCCNAPAPNPVDPCPQDSIPQDSTSGDSIK